MRSVEEVVRDQSHEFTLHQCHPSFNRPLEMRLGHTLIFLSFCHWLIGTPLGESRVHGAGQRLRLSHTSKHLDNLHYFRFQPLSPLSTDHHYNTQLNSNCSGLHSEANVPRTRSNYHTPRFYPASWPPSHRYLIAPSCPRTSTPSFTSCSRAQKFSASLLLAASLGCLENMQPATGHRIEEQGTS